MVFKWHDHSKSPLHAATARLVETLASPYHIVAAMPSKCVPFLRSILTGSTSAAYIAAQAEEHQLQCPIVFDFLFHLANLYHGVPKSIFPLLEWLCHMDALIFPDSMCVS